MGLSRDQLLNRPDRAALPRGFFGLRWHDTALPRRDMSRRKKAATCRRTPKAIKNSPLIFIL